MVFGIDAAQELSRGMVGVTDVRKVRMAPRLSAGGEVPT